MSLPPPVPLPFPSLDDGIFSNIGDEYILRLAPIVDVLTGNSFIQYDEVVEEETATRFFTREFRYSSDNITFSAWAPLTNGNLLAVPTTIGGTYYVDIRYTRAGTDATGVLIWDFFQFVALIHGVILMLLNKTNYDAIFGTNRYHDVLVAMNRFNIEIAHPAGVQFLVVNDVTMPYLKVNFKCLDQTYEYNGLIKSSVGNKLTKVFDKLHLNTNNGFESQ